MLEQTQRFKYLAAIVAEDRTTEEEIKEKLTLGGTLFNRIKHTFFGKKEIPKNRYKYWKRQ